MTAIVEKFLINDELCLLFASVYNKKFLDQIFFSGHLSHIETQLGAKNQKKISNGQGCRTGTDGRE